MSKSFLSLFNMSNRFIFVTLISSCLFFTGCFKPYSESKIKKDSLLSLEIKGMILDETAEKLMKTVRKYAGDKRIKGVILRISSPGGAVGASQEIYSLVKEIREFYKKPVFVSGGSVVASGGVYAAMSADKIFISPGTLFGSIGVIMTFKNFSELVRWAKTDVYVLKAGEFKDGGNPFREMTLREREIFENLLEGVLVQFKKAISEGRGLDMQVVDSFSDGRIFTGEDALDLGLVDHVGNFHEALKELGKITGLGSSPELFAPSDNHPLLKYFGGGGASQKMNSGFISNIISQFLSLENLTGQPLYILPSYLNPQ